MKYQDIHLSDSALRNQFVDYFMNGQYAQALNIINNNPQLDTKAFVADVMNLLSGALLALENYYQNNVPDYLVAQLEKYNTMIGNFNNRQQWVSTTVYNQNNFVYYNNLVYMYINATPTSGNLPTDTNYWVLFGLKGEQGAPSIGTNLMYQWSRTVPYQAKDVVYFNDKLYVALQNNLNQSPETTVGYWEVFLVIPKTSITTEYTYPTNPYEGMIFWKIIIPYTWTQINAKAMNFQGVNNLNINWQTADEGGW